MAGISLRSINKFYGPLHILKDFSLEIADGEFVVLVGPSGCGKSTTLKILAGLDEATSGTVLIGDRDVTDAAPADRDIAMVFQNYALYPHMTVRKNMGFGLKVRGTAAGEINRRVEAVAQTLGLGPLLERRPRQLSGGQRQRVALGRAIVREPQAFLMDEPLSNLDAKLRVRMRSEIADIHRRFKVTTVYVTHDQTEAMTMADRIVIMHDGEIQQIATPDEMYARPANLFVASFIGSPSMNFFQSEVTMQAGKPAIALFGRTIEIDGKWAEHAGRRIIVGIRPEHFSLGRGAVSFDVSPKFIESLGSEKHIHVTMAPQDRVQIDADAFDNEGRRQEEFVAKVTTSRPMPGTDSVTLSFDPGDARFFDSSSLALLR